MGDTIAILVISVVMVLMLTYLTYNVFKASKMYLENKAMYDKHYWGKNKIGYEGIAQSIFYIIIVDIGALALIIGCWARILYS